MIAYILKRLSLSIPLLLGITFITFALIKSLPGDPVLSLVGERASPQAMEQIRKEIGTNRPFIAQYIGYLRLLMKGQMGRSYFTNRPVMSDLIEKFPNTLKLALGAMIFAIPIGFLLGLTAALNQGRWADRAASLISIGGISLPVFWIGLILMSVFAMKFRWLPPSGTGDIRYLILPAITLGLPSSASIARVARTTVFDILGQPFIKAVRAKGIRESGIIFRHVLRNVMIPLVTIIGLDFGSYLNGAVLTETIFGYNGIGRFTMEGIIKRDYPVVMGMLLFGAVVFIVINMIMDIIYHYIDPRLRIYGHNK